MENEARWRGQKEREQRRKREEREKEDLKEKEGRRKEKKEEKRRKREVRRERKKRKEETKKGGQASTGEELEAVGGAERVTVTKQAQKRSVRRWTESETEILLRMRREGHAYQAIGKRVGRTLAACKNRHHIMTNPTSTLRSHSTSPRTPRFMSKYGMKVKVVVALQELGGSGTSRDIQATVGRLFSGDLNHGECTGSNRTPFWTNQMSSKALPALAADGICYYTGEFTGHWRTSTRVWHLRGSSGLELENCPAKKKKWSKIRAASKKAMNYAKAFK
jgi:hypothetical protein